MCVLCFLWGRLVRVVLELPRFPDCLEVHARLCVPWGHDFLQGLLLQFFRYLHQHQEVPIPITYYITYIRTYYVCAHTLNMCQQDSTCTVRMYICTYLRSGITLRSRGSLWSLATMSNTSTLLAYTYNKQYTHVKINATIRIMHI